MDFSQDRGCKAVSDDLQRGKSAGNQPLDRLGECATNLASNENGLESVPRNDVSSDETLRIGNKGAQVPPESEKLPKTCNAVEPLTEVNGTQSLLVKEEVCKPLLCNPPLIKIYVLFIHLTCKPIMLLCQFICS